MKIAKLIALVVAVVAFGALALKLREARYELRLDRALIVDWNDTASLQRAAHVRVMARDRQEIARLQLTQSNSIAAH